MPARELINAETWLARHPYLDRIARLQAHIDTALSKLSWEKPATPDWEAFADEHVAGTPALGAASITMDLAPVERLTAELTDGLRERLGGVPPGPGLVRCLGWRVTAAYLAPVVRAFDAWRGDDERWMRRYCPFCGSPPAMAQLVGTDPGRRRFLSCGCCGARWRFRRTECPFCEHDDHNLSTLTIEGEAGLRIDWCGSCKGYLKTYDGDGDERVLLADWTSLHLDVIALDRGWLRAAASLYDLPAA